MNNVDLYTKVSSLAIQWGSFFSQHDCEAPDIHELMSAENYKYCVTHDKKMKGKVGYIFSSSTTKYGNPCFIITINSFKTGSSTFVSTQHSSHSNTVVDFSKIHKKMEEYKSRNKKDDEFKQQRFSTLVREWEKASYSKNYYAVKKEITEQLKTVDGRLMVPLYDIEGELKGIQAIASDGTKRIYGKMKGNFYTIGDLKNSKSIYICEGLATGDAINKIAKDKCCVVIAFCINNLTHVAELFKNKYRTKEIVLCPDNDYKKEKNVGMIDGYKAGLKHQLRLAVTTRDFDGSDWNDAVKENKELATTIFNSKIDYSKFDYLCALLKLNFNQNTLENAIKTGLKERIAKQPEQEIFEIIQNCTTQNITELFKKAKKRIFAYYLRDKSIDTKRKKVGEIYYEPFFCDNMDDLQHSIDALKQSCDMPIIFINKAPMGTGKTKNFIKPNFINAKNPIVITPRRSLTHKMAEDLDAVHYSDTDEVKKASNPLAITVNSLNNLMIYERRDEVFIEEYSQIMQIFQNGGTVRTLDKRPLYNELMNLIQEARYTYIADADINKTHIDNIMKEMRGKFMICPIIFTKHQKDIEYVIYNEKDQNIKSKILIDEIESKARQGKKIFVASDSKTALKVAYNKLKKITNSIVFVNQDNIEEHEDFLKNPDEFLSDKQILLCSPSIQSGLSIEKHEFDYHYGIYQGVVKPVTFRQMLHRVRNAKKFRISVKSYQRTLTKKECDPDIMIKEYWEQCAKNIFKMQKEKLYCKDNIINIGENISIQGDKMVFEVNAFDRVIAELKTIETQQMANIENAFVIHSIADNINVSFYNHEVSIGNKKKLRKNYKEIKQIILDKEYDEIINAKNIDCEYYMKNRFSKSKEIKKYEIKKCLGLSDIEKEDIEFYEKEGESKLKTYKQLLQNNIERLKQQEEELICEYSVSKMHLKWDAVKIQLLKVIFQATKIDYTTFDGEFTEKEAINFKNSLDNKLFSNYMLYRLKLNAHSNISAVCLLNKTLFKLLGLKVDSKQSTNSRKYFIDKKSILLKYIQPTPKTIYINN